jgi:prophage maintenance system killer protein
LIRPSRGTATAFNRAVRDRDEWFDDDLNRVQRALAAIDGIDDPVDAAAVLAYRLARAQGFAEGNKRTALLMSKWLLDHNGVDDGRLIPPDDYQLADLLIKAASGLDVEIVLVELFRAPSLIGELAYSQDLTIQDV